MQTNLPLKESKAITRATKRDRRSGRDRRAAATPPVSRYLFRGRRRSMRRSRDREQSYHVDRYSHHLLLLILLVILLSVCDAALTMYLMRHGAEEANPVMAFFLRHGAWAFLSAKYLLTAASAILLLINSHAKIFRTKVRAKFLFRIIIAIFLAVIGWEVYLILFTIS